MLVYLPPLNESHLEIGPGATGFPLDSVESPPGTGSTGSCDDLGDSNPSGLEVPVYMQGDKVGPSDLNVMFLDPSGNFISPFSLVYSVGFLTGQGLADLHPIGSEERKPASVRTGLFHPNFQIGDKWFTGEYLILWKYKISEESEEETKETLFYVETSGTEDKKPLEDNFHDVQATVVVVGD